MAYVYITTPERGPLLAEIADELMQAGLAASRMRVFTARPDRLAGLPVKAVRYRSPRANLIYGAVIGGLVGLLVGVLLFLVTGFGVAPVLVLAVAMGVGGALSRLWFGQGLSGELYQLDGALRHGNAVMVLDVEPGRVDAMQRTVKENHPEVAVLGTDTEGTPPFP